MESELTNQIEEQSAGETPEDVAILYSWANLHGAKYRDFSASRREYRAQMRHRAAEDLRQAELKAKAEAEAAAAAAEEAARDAERAASRTDLYESPEDRAHALQAAEDNSRRAAAERVEAARRAEAAAMAEAAARREEREIAEAHASAQRQAARYADSEIRRRSRSGPRPIAMVPGQIDDPYVGHLGAADPHNSFSAEHTPRHVSERPRRGDSGIYNFDRSSSRAASSQRSAFDRSGSRPVYVPEVRRRPQGYRPDEASGIRPAYRPDSPRVDSFHPPAYDRQPAYDDRGYDRQAPAQFPSAAVPERSSYDRSLSDRQGYDRQPDPSANHGGRLNDPAAPAWLYAQQPAVRPSATPLPSASSVADTLQHSRERVASRWYALKGVFDQPGQGQEDLPRQREVRTPVLAVFSLAGGVGKTSLVATLGRSLSSLGEKVLLADTTSDGLLPYYFGASELRPGVVRTFSPPSGSTDAPISLVSYDVDQKGSDRQAQEIFADQVASNGQGAYRLLFDINSHNGWVIRLLARMNPTVLVPVAPDMNSVISLQAVERYFQGMTDSDGRGLQPYYVLNQFDPSLPLHLDVREVLRRQLGDRLLPLVIRRSPSVSEALAEGMTVVDYAPEAHVAEDFLSIANWLRAIAPPAASGFRTTRWSER